MHEPRIELARPDDLPAIVAISAASIHSSWSLDAFTQDANLSWSRSLVVRLPHGLAAFCTYWLVADEIQILNVATHPEHRRQGHARQLLARLIREAQEQRAQSISLEVRRSNLAAQRLYESLGFTQIGLRPRYYAEGDEDALIMQLTLTEGP
jgi:ribosomal-protein-alanine N-acetyltransferase